MFMPEVLAPVGNMNCLKAAINAGCDAVYLAGRNFGARSFAGNFSNEELVEAINICHLYGVKVYVTVNTLIYDTEVERFINYIDFLHKNNVDAVIMQDIGMIDLVRKIYPNLEKFSKDCNSYLSFIDDCGIIDDFNKYIIIDKLELR